MADGIGPLLAIVGTTASGKSALAIELAERFDGEIICADSRTVYRGMDIGTAKPTAADRKRVPHHMLDVVDPDQPFSAAQFKQAANQAILDIQARGKLPLLVGGTGLYADAILYDYKFHAVADPVLRADLNGLSVAELQNRLRVAGIALPENSQNPRHLIRALETGGARAGKGTLRPNTLIIGLDPGQESLKRRIETRVTAMFADGFLDEARRLGETYGWDTEALQTPGYKAARSYILGTRSEAECQAEFVRNDLQYAKRQRTWFRRNKSIHWFNHSGKSNKIVDLVTTWMNKA